MSCDCHMISCSNKDDVKRHREASWERSQRLCEFICNVFSVRSTVCVNHLVEDKLIGHLEMCT